MARHPEKWRSKEQLNKCNEVHQKQLGLGFTLFPGESFPNNLGFGSWELGVSASREDINKGLAVSPDGRSLALFVVGCIDYTFPADGVNHHQTGFILELRRKGPVLIRPEDGPISAADLELRASGVGESFEAN